MSPDGYDNNNSGSDVESELDDDKQKKLIDNVLNIYKKPKLKKPTRTEHSLQISEFNLIKSSTGKEGDVQLKDLTKSLKKTNKHVSLGHRIDAVERNTKTLSKPLEKQQSERIQRTINYEETIKQLNRWDPIVTSNRAASTLKFPLNHDELHMDFNAKNENCFNWGKTKLQLELEKVTNSSEVETIEVNNVEKEFPLTMVEMIEKRKQSAKLRAVQSYKEAKARRQGKIKSKKFHKIERKAKAKQQLKEFEDLQKVDPEAALEKLEELEKARAQERVSLRHKSTGKWAKNKQIRAKYDKESRQVLAEQLAISRDLTQKQKKTRSDSESDEENRKQDMTSVEVDIDNPWTSNVKIKPNKEVSNFVTNFKQFSSEQEKLGENKEKLCNKEISLLSWKNDIGQQSLVENIPLESDPPENSPSLNNKGTNVGPEIIEDGVNNTREKIIMKDGIPKPKCTESLSENSIQKNRNITMYDILRRKGKTVQFKSDLPNQIKPRIENKIRKRKLSIDLVGVENNSLSKRTIQKTDEKVQRENVGGSIWIVTTESDNLKPSKHGENNASEVSELRVTRQLSAQIKTGDTKGSKKKSCRNVQSEEGVAEKKYNSKLISNDRMDDIFYDVDNKLRDKVQWKIDALRKIKNTVIKKKVTKGVKYRPKKTKSNFQTLELRNERKRTTRVDGLHEADNVDSEEQLADLKRLEDILEKNQSKKSEEIDPNKFINIKPIKLNTELPDILVNIDDNNASDEEYPLNKHQRDVISEAFCDDNIVDDFHRDKQKDIDKNTPKDIDLTMPGWGSWGGRNLKVSNRKRRLFVLKAPKPQVRKDSNRGNLIINEDANNAKIATHMVSDVPFPYKDVREFEISLKTPIDGAFIPQTAFRKFIEPAIVTKMGTIIEPMTEDILLKKKKAFV